MRSTRRARAGRTGRGPRHRRRRERRTRQDRESPLVHEDADSLLARQLDCLADVGAGCPCTTQQSSRSVTGHAPLAPLRTSKRTVASPAINARHAHLRIAHRGMHIPGGEHAAGRRTACTASSRRRSCGGRGCPRPPGEPARYGSPDRRHAYDAQHRTGREEIAVVHVDHPVLDPEDARHRLAELSMELSMPEVRKRRRCRRADVEDLDDERVTGSAPRTATGPSIH